MEFRTGQEQGFARIWGHAHVVFADSPASLTKVEHALVAPEDAVHWLANVVDIQNDNATASGRVDAYLRPPGLPDAQPEVAVDLDVPAASGTSAEGRGRLQSLLRRYTRAPSIHLRFWYTRPDPRTGRERRIAGARPLAHLLAGDAPAPATVRDVRELGTGVWMRRPARTRCGATSLTDTSHGTLAGAQSAIREGRADLCGACFAP
jgi:hypothetical protein